MEMGGSEVLNNNRQGNLEQKERGDLAKMLVLGQKEKVQKNGSSFIREEGMNFIYFIIKHRLAFFPPTVHPPIHD